MVHLIKTSGSEQQLLRGGSSRCRVMTSHSIVWLVVALWLVATALVLLLGTGMISDWLRAVLRLLGAM